MSFLFSLLLVSAPVPDVVAGPATFEQAHGTELPIQSATVFSDRAKITRGGTVTLQVVDSGLLTNSTSVVIAPVTNALMARAVGSKRFVRTPPLAERHGNPLARRGQLVLDRQTRRR